MKKKSYNSSFKDGRIGVVLILTTFFISVHPYFLFFMVPVFLTGVLIIWRSQMLLLSKALLTVMPVLLYYPYVLLILLGVNKMDNITGQKIDFILEPGFKGVVVVIAEVPCGQKEVIYKGREQLFIPSNGILFYQEQIKRNNVNHRYKQFDTRDSLTDLSLVGSLLSKNSTLNYVLKDYGSSHVYFNTNKGKAAFQTRSFVVDELRNIDKYTHLSGVTKIRLIQKNLGTQLICSQ
jgi:hypothetical protein